MLCKKTENFTYKVLPEFQKKLARIFEDMVRDFQKKLKHFLNAQTKLYKVLYLDYMWLKPKIACLTLGSQESQELHVF